MCEFPTVWRRLCDRLCDMGNFVHEPNQESLATCFSSSRDACLQNSNVDHLEVAPKRLNRSESR